MRISDWSSDVCSSDLFHALFGDAEGRRNIGDLAAFLDQPREAFPARHLVGREPRDILDQRCLDGGGIVAMLENGAGQGIARTIAAFVGDNLGSGETPRRSEEHTSELQSLMRTSYAVFCLKKKQNQHHSTNDKHKEHSTT